MRNLIEDSGIKQFLQDVCPGDRLVLLGGTHDQRVPLAWWDLPQGSWEFLWTYIQRIQAAGHYEEPCSYLDLRKYLRGRGVWQHRIPIPGGSPETCPAICKVLAHPQDVEAVLEHDAVWRGGNAALVTESTYWLPGDFQVTWEDGISSCYPVPRSRCSCGVPAPAPHAEDCAVNSPRRGAQQIQELLGRWHDLVRGGRHDLVRGGLHDTVPSRDVRVVVRCTAPGCPEVVPDPSHRLLSWTCPVHDRCEDYEGRGDWCSRCGRGPRIHPVDGLTPAQCLLVWTALQRDLTEVVLEVSAGQLAVGDRILTVDGEPWADVGLLSWRRPQGPGVICRFAASLTEEYTLRGTCQYRVVRVAHLTAAQRARAQEAWAQALRDIPPKTECEDPRVDLEFEPWE